jgi:signal transduction histidine kinase
VLVGATASGLSDAYSTPLSGEAMRAMPGILLHAQLLNGLRGGVTLRALGNAGIGIAAATLTLLLLAVFLRLTPRQGLVLTFVLAVAWLATAVAVFRVWGLWIAPIYGVFLVLLAYPLWSWRRLEATQRYMAEEVHRLAEESDLLPAETALAALPNTALPAVDLIDARIREVRVAADRLRNLKRLLTDSLEQLPEAALVVDGAGVIALANDRAALYLAGHAAATPLAGQPLVSLLQTQLANPPGDDWQGWLAPAVQSGETLACEARSESGRDLLLRVGPIYTARAHLVGVIVTMIDITPLREAERKRDEVLRVMTHDMRSPQASILTLIEMHQVDAEAMPAATVLERTARYARRTLALADGFLKLSKAEQLSGKALPAIDLVDAINDAIDTVWPQATARRIRIARAMSLEHAILRGDHDLLTRAFSNLLGNAVKYSPDETVISVGLLDEGDYFVATVSDQGFGIPREDLPRLFSRFTRIERSNPTQADGVGLGLVMVKSFIEAHGGNVSVDSETGGAARGTVFTIRLPARHQMA